MLVCASFRPASEPGCGCPVTGGEGKCVQGRGRGRRTKRVGACRARPTGGRREGAEGVWQWFLANTKDPLATHFPSAPLSPPQINTLVVFIPGCLVSLSVGVTVCSEGQTHSRAVSAARPRPCSGVGGTSPRYPGGGRWAEAATAATPPRGRSPWESLGGGLCCPRPSSRGRRGP